MNNLLFGTFMDYTEYIISQKRIVSFKKYRRCYLDEHSIIQ